MSRVREIPSPTDAEVREALEAIRARGEMAPETIWLCVLATRNPDIQGILKRQVGGGMELLELDKAGPAAAILMGLLVGVYASGLNLGLTLAAAKE